MARERAKCPPSSSSSGLIGSDGERGHLVGQVPRTLELVGAHMSLHILECRGSECVYHKLHSCIGRP